MYQFSEEDMGNIFEQVLLEAKVSKNRRFNIVERELCSFQGIPDFIAINALNNIDNKKLLHPEASCKVLACLKESSGRKFEYIKKTTGLSENVTKNALKELIEKNFVTKNKNLYYSSISDMFESDIWAFELKLADWRRAIFQALQYKAFASYSVTVFPLEKEKILQDNIDVFKELNIGLMLLDIETSKSKWLNRPKKSKPISRWQKLYVFFKVINSIKK